jgi:TRAP-type C4-dicarboxylate transport system permease small subunit
MITAPETRIPANALERVNRAVAGGEQAVASIALAAALLISLYTIAMRALRIPTGEWVLELPIELLLVIAVYGSGALLGRRAHMRVAFLVGRLGPGALRVVTATVQLLLVAISGLLTTRAVVAAGQAARAGMHRPELLGMPESLVVWTAAFGFTLWTFHAGVGLIQAVTRPAPLAVPVSH